MRQRGFREAKEFDVAGFGDRLRALREAEGLNQTMQAFREIQNLLGNVEKEIAAAKEIAEQNGED